MSMSSEISGQPDLRGSPLPGSFAIPDPEWQHTAVYELLGSGSSSIDMAKSVDAHMSGTHADSLGPDATVDVEVGRTNLRFVSAYPIIVV